ncbi:hypothetical protein GCM10027273_16450 [Nocardioides pakistanensis]
MVTLPHRARGGGAGDWVGDEREGWCVRHGLDYEQRGPGATSVTLSGVRVWAVQTTKWSIETIVRILAPAYSHK